MALLNTHATVKKFVHFGFSEDQAEAITEAINEQNQELATKADIAAIKSEMKLVEAKLEAKIDAVENKLSSEIKNLGTELRADIRTLRADGLWLKGTLLVILGLLAKLVFFSKI